MGNATRHDLVERHAGLAKHLANRYRARGESIDDLEQIAYVGLLKAAARYDEGREASFSSFAVPTILGELRRHFRDHAWTLRVPRRLKDLMFALEREAGELRGALGREPTVDELARRLEVSREDVVEVLELGHAYRPQELDDVGQGMLAVVDDGFDRVELEHWVGELLAVLDPEARAVLRLRFREDLTQTEIAERIGRSQVHVSRVLRRSLELLRERAGASAGELAA